MLCCGLVPVDTADICLLAWVRCAVGLWPTGTAAVIECSGWSTVVACRVMARLTVALQSERTVWRGWRLCCYNCGHGHNCSMTVNK
jgi:hypothetical protein